MNDITFAEVIRGIRRAKGMTQEEVAEGICSVSSLSKMENGSQVPSRKKFQELMERLGETGYSYAHFFSGREAERQRQRKELIRALEFGRSEQAEEILWKARKTYTQQDRSERQFWKMGELLWRQLYTQTYEDYAQRCIEVFLMTRTWPDWRNRTPAQRFTRVELLLLNNAGLGYFWQGRFGEALQIYLRLYGMLEHDQDKLPDYKRKKAVICGNMSACFAGLGQMQEAWRYYERGIRCIREQGGVLLYLQLLRIRLDLCRRQKEMDDLYQGQILLYKILADLWGRAEAQERMSQLLQQPLGIPIL